MPPKDESLRQSDEWAVVCALPDICYTPVAGIPVPVPYRIIARGVNSSELAGKTFFTAKNSFHFGSFINRVEGNELGTLGGIISGVNCGVCYPLKGSNTVFVEGQPLIRHDDPFAMNAASYGSPGNTIGYAVWKSGPAIPGSDSSSNPWYKEAYGWAKKKLDALDKEFKEKEADFREAVEKGIDTLQNNPDITNQPLGEAATQFGKTFYDRGSQLLNKIGQLPGAIYEDPIGTGIRAVGDAVKGAATAIPEAATEFLNNVSQGDMGKAFGDVGFDIAEGVLGDKLGEKAKLSRDAKSAVDKARQRLDKAKSKHKAIDKDLRRANKTAKKVKGKDGGRIQGSPQKRAFKKKQLKGLAAKRKKLRQSYKDSIGDLRDAKSTLGSEQGNPSNYDLGELMEVPEPELGDCGMPQDVCDRMGRGGKRF